MEQTKTRIIDKYLESVDTECHRCGHKWKFGGKNLSHLGRYPVYAQCPKCRTSVRIPIEKLKEENKK